MDVEKTIEFLLEWQAQFAVKLDRLDDRVDKLGEHVGKMGEHVGKMADHLEGHDRQMDELAHALRRGIRLVVEEGRRERARRRELDGKIDRLAAAQLATEERLQRLIRALEQGANGH